MNDKWCAYTDGAYSKKCPEGVAIGIILLDSNNNRYKCSAFIIDEFLSRFNNVGGEVFAAYCAAKYAFYHGCNSLVVYHDYLGVANWITGLWEAKSLIANHYVYKMNRLMSRGLQITFKHVRSHSGNKWNDYVDMLSKQALNYRVDSIKRRNI